MDPETLLRLSTAASKDAKLCHELVAPRVILTAKDLVLGGPTERTIALRSELPPSEIRQIDRLMTSLVSYRNLWKDIYPGRDVDTSNTELLFDPALETARAASVIMSAAYSGYDDARVVVEGGRTFRLHSFVHGADDSSYIDRALRIEASNEETSIVRFMGVTCAESAPLTVKHGGLGALIAQLCRENPKVATPSDPVQRRVTRCVDAVELRVLPTALFGDTAKILRAIVDALADQKPTVHIALLLLGSEPKTTRFSESPSHGLSMYAPNVEPSGRCRSADGGYEDTR